ncbi:CUB and zona pellucida-like domain-containing protein 1 [Holothuria leucospilota]|uniref:CUB and zona pellucida-like domain-containing protein 1 n=1 Tax=Holothuria leucospilota TaxID=206669 RepID=A0A9Q1BTF6_HOLLE|nr:CUB and zona pellucida-like domain-containing protein 1 [Holothuria leucospilota]
MYLIADMIQFTEFSGVFTSPDYPVTPPYFTRRWSITVKEDCRILLHFLDFGLRKSNLCIPEYVELYDRAFKKELEVAKLCYSDYSEMNPSTYISSGHIFLIKLKTGCCYDRKGFKANYSSSKYNPMKTVIHILGTFNIFLTDSGDRALRFLVSLSFVTAFNFGRENSRHEILESQQIFPLQRH